MGFFDNITGRQKDRTPAASQQRSTRSSAAGARAPSQALEQSKQKIQSVEKHTPTQRASYIPPASIPNAQAFVTADTPYNAGAANYVQSVMKKKQMQDANKAEALSQAAQRQAVARNQTVKVQEKSADGWPNLPPHLDISGSDIRNPAYHALLAHVGMKPENFKTLDESFAHHLNQMVKPHKVEKRHLLAAGDKVCKEFNEKMAQEWTILASVSYFWDASNEEGSYRFFYPLTKRDRFKWSETVKGPHWDEIDWDNWNEGKRRAGLP